MNLAVLVNKENKIKKSYFNNLKLTQAKDIDNQDILVEEATYKAYLSLQKELLKSNIEIGISSAYREITDQQRIWDEYLNKYGEDYCNKYVALPGYSEHHTGLCLDIVPKINGKYLIDNKELFNQEKLYQQIYKYLNESGFILRYPKDKESITGYSYEPWHIRYVGKFIANVINSNNLTLEEYKNNFQAVLFVNKEKGMTSYDVVSKLSKLFDLKKIGHTGTLDPMAEGLLIVLIGKATKVSSIVTLKDKEYIAEVLLGVKTDTLDNTGKIISEKTVPNNLNIKEVLKSYQKTYLQEVPIYSAVRINGKRLYEYARSNEKITLPKKEVTIYNLELLQERDNTFTFKAKVSKGCYIRSLINDIGTSLNTYATMTSLKRTKQGNISLEQSSTLTEIAQGKYKLYDISDILDYPVIKVNKDIEKDIRTGKKLPNIWNIENRVIFKNEEEYILGIYEKRAEKLAVLKNFV